MDRDLDRGAAPPASEDALLPRELCHRTAVEVASATAAVALVGAAVPKRLGAREVDHAVTGRRVFDSNLKIAAACAGAEA